MTAGTAFSPSDTPDNVRILPRKEEEKRDLWELWNKDEEGGQAKGGMSAATWQTGKKTSARKVLLLHSCMFIGYTALTFMIVPEWCQILVLFFCYACISLLVHSHILRR